jgi:ABC-type Fe3+-siderophore transport system permease subunit
MFLPVQYSWLEPVLIAAVVVFFVDWIGNNITFSSRIINAFVTALIFAVIFGALVYFGYGSVQMTVNSTPSVTAPAR